MKPAKYSFERYLNVRFAYGPGFSPINIDSAMFAMVALYI
jgi:hypothetical protein